MERTCVIFKFKHAQSLIISISALRWTRRAINSCRFHSSLKRQSVFLFPSLITGVLFPGLHARTSPMSRYFIFLSPFGGRAHLHGAISYVLRRPITRVDSGSDRKSCRALPNQTPHGYSARPTFPFSWYIASAHANPTMLRICCRNLWVCIAKVKRWGPEWKG